MSGNSTMYYNVYDMAIDYAVLMLRIERAESSLRSRQFKASRFMNKFNHVNEISKLGATPC